MLGRGVYNLPEAARLTGLTPSRVREWFLGRPSETSRQPVFQGDYEPINGDRAISFLDLIELYIAGSLRNHGLSLQRLRRIHSKMSEHLNSKHPFSQREILTDGVDLFIRNDEDGRDELVDILRDQRVFPSILLPFLKSIEFDPSNHLAKRWNISEMVVVDPSICFGKPIIDPVGMSTTILAQAYRANGDDADLVAYWYNVKPEHVMAAVEFENRLAA
ncbi:MAG: DUF433 domain-containing protein [Isosphaeraceae bacterium]